MGDSLVDVSNWPLVVVRLPREIGEAEVAALVRGQDEVFQRRERYVSVADTTAVARLPGARVRASIADWLRRIEPSLRRYQTANALIIENPLTRGSLTAIHWLAPPPNPTEVHGTLLPGVRFVLAQAERAGLDVEPIRRFESTLTPRSVR